MRQLYSISISVYGLLIYVYSFFNQKAKLWVDGRKNWAKKLEDVSGDVIWIHCASLGEYEQGKPILEQLKQKHPSKKILLSFFSPSGYELQKNNTLAEWVIYLPLDKVSNAKKFINLTKPSLAIFIKYEFWANYILELKQQNIPTYVVSAIFRKNHFLFKPYAKWYLRVVTNITHFFVQNETSKQLLSKYGINQTTVSGDSRFDRVQEIAQANETDSVIAQFKGDQPLMVCGSVWSKDMDYINAMIIQFPTIKFLIAPHDLSYVEQLKKLGGLYSEQEHDMQVMILDTMGMLSSVYRYADISYIGGGFGKGIHNTLEAAVYGCPIIFGPNYTKFNEAKELIKLKTAISINDCNAFEKAISSFLNKTFDGKASVDYCKDKCGSAKKIIDNII